MSAAGSIDSLAFLARMGHAKWRILLAFSRRLQTQSRLLTAVLGTFLAGYLGAAYFLFYEGLHFVNGFPLVGTLILRTHTAVVEIPYSATSYSIRYRSSIDLNEAGGKIHKNYNSWVQNLTHGINGQLATL